MRDVQKHKINGNLTIIHKMVLVQKTQPLLDSTFLSHEINDECSETSF